MKVVFRLLLLAISAVMAIYQYLSCSSDETDVVIDSLIREVLIVLCDGLFVEIILISNSAATYRSVK